LTFLIEVGGRRRDVAVRRVGRGFEVTLDGRRITADLVRVGTAWSLLVVLADAGPDPAANVGPMKAGHDSADNDAGGGARHPNAGTRVSRPMQSYDVAFEGQPGGATVYINGQPIPVMMNDGAARFGGRGSSGDPGSHGPRRIAAPMPGRVVKVLVKVGDAVEARQGLVVVEAMKMENELRAPGTGTVTEVKVTEGASVEANAVLVVISPATP